MDWTAAQTISNIILVTILIIVTIYYAFQTAKLVKITEKTLRHERLIKEMNVLVGPLYSILDDRTVPYLYAVYHSHEGSQYYQEIYAFWRDVKKNVYLAPIELRESLKVYLDARQKYRINLVNRATSGEEITATKAVFDQAIEDLMPKIKERYDALIGQIELCENDLHIY